MDEFRTLLNQLWIRREDDRELFYRIRRKLPDLRRTLRDQFGWEVVSTETLIRLVKEPGKADAVFGISDFTESGIRNFRLYRNQRLLPFVRCFADAGGQGRRSALFAV